MAVQSQSTTVAAGAPPDKPRDSAPAPNEPALEQPTPAANAIDAACWLNSPLKALFRNSGGVNPFAGWNAPESVAAASAPLAKSGEGEGEGEGRGRGRRERVNAKSGVNATATPRR